MKYKEHLLTYRRSILYEYAKVIGIKGTSKLNKKELVEKIEQVIFDPDNLYDRLTIFTDPAIELLKKALIAPYKISEDEKSEASFLTATTLGEVDADEKLTVVDEVGNCSYIFDLIFDEQRRKMVWMLECMRTACAIYWIYDSNVLIQIFRHRYQTMTDEQIMNLIQRVPKDFQFWEFDKELNIFYAKSRLLRGDIKRLYEKQEQTDFHILSEQEVIDFIENGYLLNNAVYQQLIDFLVNDLKISAIEAENFVHELSLNLCSGSEFLVVTETFFSKMKMKTEKQVYSFIDLLMNAYNNTRMIRYRGHTPLEMAKDHPNMITVLGQAERDMVIDALSEELSRKGFEIIKNKNSVHSSCVVKKIKLYPNSPCPCGSGKKYKKCCGGI